MGSEIISHGTVKNAADAHVQSTLGRDDDDEPQYGTRVATKYRGTIADQREMSALGRVQVLRRNFRFFSVLGFGCGLIGTWEFILTLIGFGLTDGGTAGLIYGFIVVWVGFTMVYLSISEMASMAPTSGGQYHWVSEFAPPSAQKYLSYIIGYLVATGWQTSVAATAFLAGTTIQGLLVLNDASYVFERWHGTLLVIAVVVFSIIFNTFLAKKLPMIEGIILIIYIIGFFAIIIPLWVLSPLANAHDVFTQFTNAGGWSSTSTAFMVGLSGVLASICGFDCVVHMAEEIKDASETLPRAILTGAAVNGTLGFLMVITLCFTVGDVNAVITTPTGYPFIQIFYNNTQSYSATNVMTTIVIVVLTSAVISMIATSSRQLWSFARDGGLPFSRFLVIVKPGSNIPLNAICITLIVTILLSLINIGSTVALLALSTLSSSALTSSYILTISCVLLKRLRGQPLPTCRWSLGRYGMAINILALCFLCPLFVFVFFPLYTPVVPSTMNWSCLIFGSVILFATAYYVIYGRKQYIPPVSVVKREQYEM